LCFAEENSSLTLLWSFLVVLFLSWWIHKVPWSVFEPFRMRLRSCYKKMRLETPERWQRPYHCIEGDKNDCVHLMELWNLPVLFNLDKALVNVQKLRVVSPVFVGCFSEIC
jgi:hypothetical protein